MSSKSGTVIDVPEPTFVTEASNFVVTYESRDQIEKCVSNLNFGYELKTFQVDTIAALKQRRHVFLVA